MDTIAVKRCPSCERLLSINDFGKHSYTLDGFRSHCKECTCKRRHKYYWSNPERARQLDRNLWNKDIEKSRKRKRDERLANLDHARKRDKDYYARTAEYRREYSREWTKRNPEKARAKVRKWDMLNPEKRKTLNHKKRAIKLNADGSHTKQDIDLIRKQQNDCCAHLWCKKPLHGKGHRDHITPLSRGGSNWPENIQLLCIPCNLRKSNLLPNEFAIRSGYIMKGYNLW